MSHSLSIAAVAPQSGKSLIALGVMNLLARSIEKVCFFRPVIRAGDTPDNDIELESLLNQESGLKGIWPAGIA